MRLAVLRAHEDGYALQRILVDSDADIKMQGCLVHVLKTGSPAGSMRFQLLMSDATTVAAYSDVALSTITDTHWHGYVYFALPFSLRRASTYYFNMNSTGYTYGASDYFATVLADGLSYNNNPGIDFRILSYRNVNRGRA